MAIDQSEDLVAWRHAAKSIPGAPHISTLHRWRLRGVRGHRLESILVGGSRYTSQQAITRFISACNTPADAPAATPSFTVAQRQKMSDAARQELAATFGI
jgi:hypothetical protein